MGCLRSLASLPTLGSHSIRKLAQPDFSDAGAKLRDTDAAVAASSYPPLPDPRCCCKATFLASSCCSEVAGVAAADVFNIAAT